MKDGMRQPWKVPKDFQEPNRKILDDERFCRRALSLSDAVVAKLDISQKRLSLVWFEEELEVEAFLEGVPESLIEEGWVHANDEKICKAFLIKYMRVHKRAQLSYEF